MVLGLMIISSIFMTYQYHEQVEREEEQVRLWKIEKYYNDNNIKIDCNDHLKDKEA